MMCSGERSDMEDWSVTFAILLIVEGKKVTLLLSSQKGARGREGQPIRRDQPTSLRT